MTAKLLSLTDLKRPREAVYTVFGCNPKGAGQSDKALKMNDYALAVVCFECMKEVYKLVQLSATHEGHKRCLISYDAANED